MGLLFTSGEYDVYGDTANFLCGVTTTAGDVILGNGSLRAEPNTTNLYRVHSTRNAAPRQFVNGYGYMSIRYRDTSTTSVTAWAGYLFHLSQADVSGTTGTFKTALLQFTAGQVRAVIYASTAGLNNVTAGITVATDYQNYSLGDIFSLAVKWAYSTAYGGTNVRLWWGAGSTIPDTTVPPTLAHTYAGTVAPTTLGEGEFLINTKSSGTPKMIVDQIGRREMILAA